MTKRPFGLTPKQEAFAAHYALHGDASAAYRHAYDTTTMSAKSVNEGASRVLAHAKVAARVAGLTKEKERIAQAAFGVTAEQVLAELAAIGFANMADYVRHVGGEIVDDVPELSIRGLSRDKLRAVAEITVEDIESGKRTGKRTRIKLHDKRAALVDLGRHLGLFREQHHHTIDLTSTAAEFDARLAQIVARAAGERASREPGGSLN